jgi:hypothetical protein
MIAIIPLTFRILVAEVFPLRVRGRGVAAATLGSGISNFIVSITFLSLIEVIEGARTFAIYGAMSILTLLFVRFIVPETCGRDLESISLVTESQTSSRRNSGQGTSRKVKLEV